MKIAIESNDGETLNSPFCKTRGYIICDIDNASITSTKYVKIKSGYENLEVGSKRRTLRKNIFSLSDCRTVITRGMARNSLKDLKENGIDVFVTFNTRAKDALSAYLKERLLNRPVFH